MDTELLVWVLFFVGGYSVIVGYLLRIALAKRDEEPSEPPAR